MRGGVELDMIELKESLWTVTDAEMHHYSYSSSHEGEHKKSSPFSDCADKNGHMVI